MFVYTWNELSDSGKWKYNYIYYDYYRYFVRAPSLVHILKVLLCISKIILFIFKFATIVHQIVFECVSTWANMNEVRVGYSKNPSGSVQKSPRQLSIQHWQHTYNDYLLLEETTWSKSLNRNEITQHSFLLDWVDLLNRYMNNQFSVYDTICCCIFITGLCVCSKAPFLCHTSLHYKVHPVI